MRMDRHQFTVQDRSGNVVDGCSIEVREEVSGSLAALKSDSAGTTPMANPFTAADGANVAFYVVGGFYEITATLGAFEQVWPDVAIGNAQGMDLDGLVPTSDGIGTTNNIYVDPVGGDDSNTGDATNDALLTLAAALDLVPMLPVGTWNIIIAAGTLTPASVTFNRSMSSNFVLAISGPALSAGVPVAIFDGNNSANFGLYCEGDFTVTIDRIKCLDYGYAAVSFNRNVNFTATDIHVVNCGFTGSQALEAYHCVGSFTRPVVDCSNGAGTKTVVNGIVVYNAYVSLLDHEVFDFVGHGVLYGSGGGGHVDGGNIHDGHATTGIGLRTTEKASVILNTDCVFDTMAVGYWDDSLMGIYEVGGSPTFTSCTLNRLGSYRDHGTRAAISGEGSSSVFEVLSADGATTLFHAGSDKFAMEGVAYSRPIREGNAWRWWDGSNRLRYKIDAVGSSPPSSESDGKIVPDLEMSPTWTGAHVFSGAQTKFDLGITSTDTITLADDTSTSLTLPGTAQVLSIVSTSSTRCPKGMLFTRPAGPTIQYTALFTDADVVTTTGALSGTTGTDAKFTMSVHTDGKLYLENRAGGARQSRVTYLGAL